MYRANNTKGLRLLLRDHAHSHFCVGASIPDRPSLDELIQRDHAVRSIVTVRHPIDSYLALLNNKWLHFEPATVDEYALRYEAFLDFHADAPLFRYEDFIDKTDDILRAISNALDLEFPEGYRDLFMVHGFSGDSGRSGSAIAPRPRRRMSEALEREFAQSDRLHRLAKRLGYGADHLPNPNS